MSKRNLVLFLGAGFSTDGWKLPIMSRFGERSDQQRRKVDGWKTGKTKNCAPLLAEAAQTFKDVQEWLSRSGSSLKVNPNDMEQIATVPEVLRHMVHEPFQFGDRPQSLGDVEKQIAIWLWKIYQACPMFDHDQYQNNEPKKEAFAPWEFIKLLKRECKETHSVSVLTTNYDIVFETYCWKQGWPCTYPLQSGFASIRFGSGGTPSRMVASEVTNPATIYAA